MMLANVAYDLQAFSKGRFSLGLGSQIKAHIEKRFSMPWSHPAARMRELVQAIRAIWAAWSTGDKLDFRGEFYRHTLMTPLFNPGPNPYGDPEDRPRRGRGADDRGRGRGRRRHDPPRLHDRAVRPRGDAARARARLGEGGQVAGRLRDLGPAVRRDRRDRGGLREGARRDEAADRVLRLDARVPAGARAPRLGRPAGRAQPAVEAGRVGADGRARSTTTCSTRSRSSPSPRTSPRCCSRATATSSTGSASTRPYRSDPERWKSVLAGFKQVARRRRAREREHRLHRARRGPAAARSDRGRA